MVTDRQKTDPQPGQLIYVWNYREKRPIAVTFVERRGSWYTFERDGKRFKENGLPAWTFDASQCAWGMFRNAVLAAGKLADIPGFKKDKLVEDAFALACEYTRLFADSLGKTCGDVQDERRSSAKAGGET